MVEIYPKKGMYVGWDWFLALFLFVAVAGLTPGPNNIIAMAIGFNHGYQKVLPHLMGVTVGFPVMLLLIGLVLRPLMDLYPGLFMLLKYLSIAYILYLAWKIATAPVKEELEEGETLARHPITFVQSLMLQWINPKAWAGALTIVTIYTRPERYAVSLFAAAFVTIFMTFSAVSLWAFSGKALNMLMRDPRKIRFFNITMALLLVLSVGMMLF